MMQALKPLKISLCVVPLATQVKELKSFLIGLIQITATKKVSKKAQLLQLSEKHYKGLEAFLRVKVSCFEILGILWFATDSTRYARSPRNCTEWGVAKWISYP